MPMPALPGRLVLQRYRFGVDQPWLAAAGARPGPAAPALTADRLASTHQASSLRQVARIRPPARFPRASFSIGDYVSRPRAIFKRAEVTVAQVVLAK